MDEKLDISLIKDCSEIGEAMRFIETLIAESSLNIRDNGGRTILHWAVHSNKYWLVQLILSFDIDVNVRDNTGETPLTAACIVDNYDMVKLLLNNGANCNIYDNNKDGPLLWSSYKGNIDIVRLLVEEGGADVEHLYQDGRNAIMWAAKRNQIDVIDYLYYKTTTIGIRDKSGSTFEDLCSGYTQTLKVLGKKNINRNYSLYLLFDKYKDHPLLEKNLFKTITDHLP